MLKAESTPPFSTGDTASASVPLDSPLRAVPIHPDLPEIKLPEGPLPPHSYHPVTCEPIKAQDHSDELRRLEQEYTTKEAALLAQERTAQEVKEIIQTAQRKREEIQKAMDKKVKERDTEMKVVSKFQEAQATDMDIS
ncbi:unnamed protein product [Penicillium olsonii]|uniref:Uncharacterized protein n=1 Tax=Penicillium olsonii TaxID=99116 RepID=A0A9W4MZ25_PENOL|nr:unnamed protein product [Penicillium olsonii]CAG8179601.1 unnamed protein product [Penicillium olsonii]